MARTLCAASSHMEPEPYGAGAMGTAVPAGGWEPRGTEGRGHAVPTCLGSHRGAQECLETGGAELADCPHAVGVPRRKPPAPGGQGRDRQR